jgi:uncharacterized protein (TIGR02246 family)
MKHLTALCVACFLTAGAHAQQTGPEEAFDRFAQALAAGDIQAMVALHSDDAILVPSNGGPFVQGKAAVEAYYKAVFANTTSRRAIKTPGTQWQVYGDTAVRTSNGILEVETDKGKNAVPLRNMYVFHKEGQDWKLVSTSISMRTTPTSAPTSASK